MPFDASPAPHSSHAAAIGGVLTINVKMPDGGWVAPPAMPGARIVDILANFGLAVRLEGDGQRDRFAPHVRIHPDWLERLSPVSEEEAKVLLSLGIEDERSRLLDQLVMTADLDGIEIELPWEALVPQTYWIAG